MTKQQIRLATRGSQLALIQAEKVRDALRSALGETVEVSILPFSTQGDRDLSSPLSAIGGKGAFIKDIEYALITHQADIAVHSLKDITARPEKGLCLSGFLAAESVKDAFVFKTEGQTLARLAKHSRIATGSLRRKALLTYFRPDLITQPIRGNVLTRIETLNRLPMAATLLSEAGLMRLNLMHLPLEICDPTVFIPAPGQGVIALETRRKDHFFAAACQAITDNDQALLSTTELHFLKKVGLDCRAPLGLYSKQAGESIHCFLFLANQALSQFFFHQMHCSKSQRFEKISELAEITLAWLHHHDTVHHP